MSFESGGNDGKETQEKRSRREESRWKKKKRSRRGEPEEDKKYMRIRREAAGQEEKEREQNLIENSINCTLEVQETYHIIFALPVHLLRQVYKLS